MKNIEALTRQNEALQRELDGQRRRIEEQSQSYEREIAQLRSQHQQPGKIANLSTKSPEALVQNAAKAREPVARPTSGNADVKTIEPLKDGSSQTMQRIYRQSFQQLLEGVDTLASSIIELHREVDSTSMKSILAHITHQAQESHKLLERKEEALQAFDNFCSVTDDFAAKQQNLDTVAKVESDSEPATNGF